MKIVHIISKQPSEAIRQIILDHSKEHEVVVVDLNAEDLDYEDVVKQILSGDRVISWTSIQDATIH